LIRRSRLAGKTLFEMQGPDQDLCTQPFEEMAEYLTNGPLSDVPSPLGDREIFDVIGGWK
ncbi:MAG TPA: ferredoxin:protochlorophyllide reductase (ATP-dependent) iron-sulfur ATP-binding protein, partial [Roseiflexaceae bacterium]|nr:ferredoxin:protochlorophyllide reductase (ATP-dependent) iron-sulfur ATP-binding protein [Roseiflexaceae bacterium]